MATARELPPEEVAEDTSFARGLRLLLAVADRGDVRADELASVLDMPISSVYRYLRTLAEFGFVDRHQGVYRLGAQLFIGTGSRVTSQRLIAVADPVLNMLVDETGESALVARRIGLSAVCLHQVESRERLRVTFEPGAMLPLDAGAVGRVLLAYAPPDVLDEVLGAGLKPVTAEPIQTADALRDRLDDVVRTGGAISHGEFVPGSVAVAVPIVGEEGIVASLAVVGPEVRCGPRWQSRARRILGSAAEAIASALTTDLRTNDPPTSS
jgi:DNA-binding IclR family transcriptional regulator